MSSTGRQDEQIVIIFEDDLALKPGASSRVVEGITQTLVSHTANNQDLVTLGKYGATLGPEVSGLHSNAYITYPGGELVFTRPLNILPAALKGQNQRSVSVFFCRDLTKNPLNQNQLDAFSVLRDGLLKKLPSDNFYTLHELNPDFAALTYFNLNAALNTSNPCKNIKVFYVQNLEELALIQGGNTENLVQRFFSSVEFKERFFAIPGIGYPSDHSDIAMRQRDRILPEAHGQFTTFSQPHVSGEKIPVPK